MTTVEQLIIDNLDVWSSVVKAKSASGRGRGGGKGKKLVIYGIKKLRELILELAVRGLLLPQDINDEPASELLKKFAAEKTKLLKEDKIKNTKKLPPINKDEEPFVLPDGWSLARLGDLSHMITKGTTPTSIGYAFEETGINFIKIENLDCGRVDKNSISQFISEETNNALARSQLCSGDLLFSIAGTIGKTAIVYDTDLPANTNQALAIIKGTGTIYSPSYLRIQLDSFVAEKTKKKARGGAMPNVSLGDITVLVSPIPPLAEQDRIVTKVDELMALCDQLEQQTETSISAHKTLVQTLLGALTNVSKRDGFNRAWARIAEHFDTLFTTEWSIDQLKQTILQLAVMGKLIPQNPSDEPASELLKKIAAEKDRLFKEGKIKKQKTLPPIGEGEKPFELPEGWEWCRLQDSIDVRDGTHDSPKDAEGENTFPLVTSKNFIDGMIDLENARQISEQDHIDISKRSLVEVDDILFSMIGGNIGNQVIVREPRPFSVKNVALFKYYDKSATEPKFFKVYTEELAIELQQNASGGAQPFVSLGALRKLVFALPPIKEQRKIVAKVNELMALCNSLKTSINAAQIFQLQLADAMAEQPLN